MKVDRRPTPEARQVSVDHVLALQIIASRGCEMSTLGLGSCITDGRSPVAQFGAFQACGPCIAYAALGSPQA